jgi:hypothetical protein
MQINFVNVAAYGAGATLVCVPVTCVSVDILILLRTLDMS